MQPIYTFKNHAITPQMSPQSSISEEKLRNLQKIAQWGWWKADFYNQTILFSDYIVELLHISTETLTFDDFFKLIREDYRECATNEFMAIREHDLYNRFYPINSIYGEKWIYSGLGEKEMDENGHLIAWGYCQSISDQEEIEEKKSQQKFNDLLYRQNSISRSLLSFLKTEMDDSSEIINKILKDILIQFRGSRVYIFEYNLEKQTQNCTFEVSLAGISKQQKLLTAIPMNATPWWTNQIRSYSPIVLFDLDELPAEAAAEKELLEKQDIKSLMVTPLIAKDHVWGYMGIDITDVHRSWTNEDYQWFATLCNIISICIELHKSELTARKEREYFSNLYKYMPIGYIRLNVLYNNEGIADNYRILDLNPSFEKITGFSTADLLNKTAQECGVKEEMLQEQLQYILPTLTGNTHEQITYKTPQISKHLRVIIYSPEPDQAIILFSDMTDIVKAHEALDKSEKTLRNIYKNIPVGIEIYDKDGYLRDMNDKNVEIFGLQDKSWGLGINIFDNPNFPNDVKQQIKEQKDVDFEIKYNFSDVNGYYKTMQNGVKDLIVKLTTLHNSQGELENYLLILIDNTETTTAYSRICEFESFFSVIADFAKIGYFKWNLKTKTGFAINQWFKNWGETENSKIEDVIGTYQHIHPDDRKKILGFFDDLNNGVLSGFKEEVRVSDGKGDWRWIRCNVTVKNFDPEDHNIELIGVNFDITELKQAEAKLREAKNKAETLDKLKSAFLANMSHEIRTPLNAIVGFSHLLAETEEEEEKRQYISIIQENNELLLQLISDVLDLSKIEAGTLDIIYGDVNINTLGHEIVRSLELKAGENVELEFIPGLPECIIRADRNRLMQIISNFINNALKFTPKGYISLSYHLHENMIEFDVTDSGIGISKENLPTVFDRFVKLNSFINGTGLGLSICKSMVEQMGGSIGVNSEEGKGSRFWFRLPFVPVAEEPEKTYNTLVSNNIEQDEKKPVILIAEDTESNFILVSTILKKEYTILWARTGIEALKLYRQENPALILMDINMPEMNGLEATRVIRESDQHTPIVALTAFAFDSDKVTALEAGCNEYISKPIQAPLLKKTLQKLIYPGK